jgi:hypothetical protein
VYIRPFAGVPAGADKTQISERGGYFAAWRGDSKELFFIGADSSLYSTSIGPGGAVSKPVALFPVCPGNTPTGSATQSAQYDVAHDGQRFLFACASELLGQYTVIVNCSLALR